MRSSLPVTAWAVLLHAVCALGVMDMHDLPPPALLLPCDGLDTCQQGHASSSRASRPLTIDTDWKERNCLCDNDCAMYSDCCDDASTVSQTEKKKREFECRDMRNFGGIYMIHHCSKSWRGSSETKRLCEDMTDSSDPISSSMPVTDKSTATTYRNVHCAVCNMVPGTSTRENWEMWGARLECSSVLTGSRDLASVRHALRFENGTWGLRLPRHIGGPATQPPAQKTEEQKNSKLIYDKLEPFLSVNDTRSRLFRGRRIQETTTTSTERVTTVAPVSTISGLRHLSRRHYALYNASQFHRNDSALAALLRLRRLGAGASASRNRRQTPPTDEVFHKCELDPLLPDTLTHLVRRCRPKVNGDCPASWPDEKVRQMCRSHTAHVFNSGTTYRNVYCAMCWGVPVQELSCHQVQLATRGSFNKDFNLVAFAVLFDFGRGQGSVGATSCATPDKMFDPFLGVCRQLVCSLVEGTERSVNGSCVATSASTDFQGKIDVGEDELTNCSSSLMLEKHDFVILNDSDMKIVKTGALLPIDKYSIFQNGSAKICDPLSLFNRTLSQDSGEKFGPMLGYITLVGLGISIVCLTLHLIAFCVVSERSLHGNGGSSGTSNSTKNLASLCVALLIAYCSFVAGQFVDERYLCVSSAIITYYAFLVAFTWMFAVSLDIWRALRLATTQLRTSYGGRKHWRKFLFNSLCCWLLPAVVVIAAIIVEHSPEDAVDAELRPGFGARPGVCWFSHRRSLLVFFAAPIALVMLLNAIFFTSSALMIYSTTASTLGGPRRDFRLYLRLAVLMGLTWSVGLLAGFLDTPLLWVVFVVLNTLQGLFIFLAFTCTKKMMRSLKDSCYCGRWHCKGSRVCTSSSLSSNHHGALDAKKLGAPIDAHSHLPWSPFNDSVISNKSSQSEESSRATDETLY